MTKSLKLKIQYFGFLPGTIIDSIEDDGEFTLLNFETGEFEYVHNTLFSKYVAWE
jgi:hypothetical protein